MNFGRGLNDLYRNGSGPRGGASSARWAEAASRWKRDRCLRRLFTYCGRAASGRRYHVRLAAPVRSISTFNNGRALDCFCKFGVRGWRNTMSWKGLLGSGKALMERKAKRHWRPNAWGPVRRIGGKNGRKKSVLVDGRGVPLSIIGSGANVHDVKLLAATLDAVVLQRPAAKQHLCGDAGYTGKPAHQAVVARHYQPHIRARGEENIIRKKRLPRPALGGRTHPLLAQSLSQTAGQLRENQSQLSGITVFSLRAYRLATNHLYLRISSKLDL